MINIHDVISIYVICCIGLIALASLIGGGPRPPDDPGYAY